MERIYTNKHHILHHRKLHEANPDSKLLRNALGMIAVMEVFAHRELHEACPGVPPLDLWTAQRTRANFRPAQDPLKAIDNYLLAVQTAIKSPKNHPIERELAELNMLAVELQIPFIKEGLIYEEA